MFNKTRCVSILIVCILSAAFTAQAAIIPRLNSGQSMNICAIGTSLTDKQWNYNTFGGYAWFEQMGGWLQSRYPGQVTLSNRAVAGAASAYTPSYTTPEDGIDQLNDVLTNDNPDAIFIEFAINDSWTPDGISLAQSEANLQTMINTIHTWGANHSKEVDIVVLSMSDYYGPNRPDLPDYYQGYADVAAANASNDMLFINNYANWKNLHDTNLSLWETYMADGIHPSPTGAAHVTVPQVESSLLNQQVTPSPEPSALVLLSIAGLALVGAGLCRRRKGK